MKANDAISKDGDLEIREGYIWKPQLCPICQSIPTSFLGKRGGRAHRAGLGVECEIWMCTKCKLLFPNPMPIPKDGLDQHYNVEANEYFAAHDESLSLQNSHALIQQAEELLGGRGKLLDVGVGRGEKMKAALDLGWDCEGIEPSPTFADHAEKVSGCTIWQGAIENAELPPGEFDVVILAAVLEHLYQPYDTLRAIARTLKTGGLLFLDVPNEMGLYFRIGNLYQKLRGRDWCVNLAPTFSPYHVFGFTPRSLRLILSKHGLKPVKWKVYPGISLVPEGSGVQGAVESIAAKIVTAASRFGELGTYIEAWAVKEK